MSGRKRDILRMLVGSDARAQLLTFFHANPARTYTLDDLAHELGKRSSEITTDLVMLVESGVVQQKQVYSFDADGYASLRGAISEELKEATVRQEQEPSGETLEGPVGIDIIDHVVPSGIPSPAMILIMGDPGTAKSELCLEFVVKSLSRDRYVFYVTLEQSPEEIRASLNGFGGDVTRPERLRNFGMLDCYSSQIGVASKERYSADPNNLSELSIAVSKAIESRTQGLFVLDSLDTLIRKRGLLSSLELIRTLRAKTRIVKFDSIVTLNRQAFPTAILAAVQESVDGVFEMKVQEDRSGLTRYFRVPKMRGVPHSTSWTMYDLEFKRAKTDH